MRPAWVWVLVTTACFVNLVVLCWRGHYRTATLVVLTMFVVLSLSGCASVAFPREPDTQHLEAAWLGMHAIDTVQTIGIAKHPERWREANPLASAVYGTDHPSAERVVVTNVAMAVIHSSVSRWLDDGLARAQLRDDGLVGPWAVGRFVWFGLSFLGTGYAVSNNALNGV